MRRDAFDRFCGAFNGASHIVQWGGASVWKIGGKIFAICSGWGAGDHKKISFKCSDLAYELLKERPGLIPAPYLGKAKWIQVAEPGAMSDEDIEAHIETAYQIVSRKLTKAARKELGLERSIG